MRVGDSGGGGFFARSPSPGPLSRRNVVGENAGGEAASLREAPLPQTPSPEERLAFELRLFFLVGSACELGAFPIGWVVVTAADRAAATFAALGKEPLRPPMAGTSPFRGGFAGRYAKRLPL